MQTNNKNSQSTSPLTLDNKISDLLPVISAEQVIDIIKSAPELTNPIWIVYKQKRFINRLASLIIECSLEEDYINDFLDFCDKNLSGAAEANNLELQLWIIKFTRSLGKITPQMMPHLLNAIELDKQFNLSVESFIRFGTPEQSIQAKIYILENLSEEDVSYYCRSQQSHIALYNAIDKTNLSENYSREDFYADLPVKYKIEIVI